MFHETSKTCWKLQLWLHVVGFNLFMARPTHNNVNAAKPILYGYINICMHSFIMFTKAGGK